MLAFYMLVYLYIYRKEIIAGE
eukprot:SAG11_NODE_47590_length_128_cov_186.068966_1_plen_21_part_10